MKRTISTYRFKMNMVFRGTILIAPTIFLAAFLGFMYSVAPATVTSSFLLSGLFLFLVSIYISMNMAEKEHTVQEQLLLLHCRTERAYYTVRELVLCSVIVLYTVALVAVPVTIYFRRPDFFTRPFQVRDVVCGGLFVLTSGMCGGAVGDLLHPRIMKDRNNAIVLAVFIALLSICKTGIVKEFSITKYILWILPPVMDGFEMVGSSDLFDVSGSTAIFAHAVIYVVLMGCVKIGKLKKNKFAD